MLLLFIWTLSCVQLFATPWTVAHQAPLSVEFSRWVLEWVVIPFSRGSNPCLLQWQADSLPTEPPGKLHFMAQITVYQVSPPLSMWKVYFYPLGWKSDHTVKNRAGNFPQFISPNCCLYYIDVKVENYKWNSLFKITGTSLVVQWLRLETPNTGGLGSISGQGTRSHMPQLKSL